MKERIKWIDVAKGYGIIFVIYGHVATDMFATWLYTFHVPLFFFLSGYFFNPDKNPKDFLHSKTKGLLLPYLTLGIPLFIINLHYGFNPIDLIIGYAIQQRASTLWFIGALFMQFLIAYMLYRTVKSALIRWLFIFSLSIVALILWRNDIPSLPWNIDVSMVTLPFFCLGHDLREKEWFKKILNCEHRIAYIAVFLTFSIIGTLIMCHLPIPTVDLCASQFNFEPLAYITAFAGIMATCLIANKWYSRILSYIGRNSIVYFVWQQDIAIMLVTLTMKKFHFLENLSGTALYFKNILIVILSLIILTILNEIIIKTKLRIILGK